MKKYNYPNMPPVDNFRKGYADGNLKAKENSDLCLETVLAFCLVMFLSYLLYLTESEEAMQNQISLYQFFKGVLCSIR